MMAMMIRRRTPKPLRWLPEAENDRDHRRAVLCELDGLLTQLEDVNLGGGIIPHRVLRSAARLGVPIPASPHPAALMDAIFASQEAYMRKAIVDPSSRRRRSRPMVTTATA